MSNSEFTSKESRHVSMKKENDISTDRQFPTKGNRHVIQSYIFSTARNRFSIVQMRILYRLVEFAQCEIEGLLIKDRLTKIEHSLRHVTIELPIASILPVGSKHYEQVRAAIMDMMDRKCELWDTSAKRWRAATLIANVDVCLGEGIIRFDVADFVWDSMLDFTHGFRKYELATILSLHSPNSMKMYALISGLEYPITYSLEKWRDMFGVTGKYDQPADFIKKIIKPCKAELDRVCPYGFDFKAIKQGRKIGQIMILPYKIEKNRDANLERKVLASQTSFSLFFSHVYNYLRYQIGFRPQEIKANQILFEDCTKELPDVLHFLESLKGRRRNADGSDKSLGWIINACRSELAMIRANK